MLVEMLVAMAVGAFLLIALASLTSFLLRAYDRTAEAARENENTGRALAALSRDVELALPTRWAGKDAAFVFSGTSTQMLFARASPSADGLDEIQAFRFEVSRTDTSTRLVRYAGTLPPSATASDNLAWNPPVTVYVGSASVAFAYFMKLEGGGEAVLDDWPAGDEMPVAVRASFLPARPGGQVLSLRIPLLIDTELACALPDSENCGGGKSETEAGTDDKPAGPVEAGDPLGWNHYAR